MSRSQRLTFLGIAAVIAVVAVVVILAAGGDDEDSGTQASATQTATPTPTQDQSEASPEETETPTPTAAPKPPLLKAGKVTRLEFEEGDTIKFRVVSDVDEEVHVHGYDIAKDIGAGETITMSFKATIEGIFEIEFEHAKEQIGELRVEPN